MGIIDLSFNSNVFGRVLLVKPSMFGKLEVHASEVHASCSMLSFRRP